ncbi:EamA family transporter RarD [Allobranchiibius sp. CTAmp26]|uniref:EamA family transporter RarD n=1 Tax=Allobranchiibius sp. CTAmp26 TaxID=2815214 RepID=UPI001AA0DB0F|nr:EamA family transporter RarD [Allobranchiibius sp. CTAmp26]MBO1755121.1 EamA family transporter RarD [Allobranchiibius sp. CTAmp26]
MANGKPARSETSTGTAYGFVAYLLWGAFPLYFHAIEPVGAWEVLAHRVLWTLLVCAVILAVRRRMGFVREVLSEPRRLIALSIASLLIAANWTIYVQAVVTGHVTEAALGYFLNPLVTVALGVVVLKERLRMLQWVAVAIGLAACVYLGIDYGKPPWIAVSLALSFAGYGLMKKRVGGRLTALESLSFETAVLAPIAAILLVVLTIRGDSTFTTEGTSHAVLLAVSGIVTAVPLLLFAAAARRVPLVTIGLLQFLTPILQLICGVALLGEHMSSARWVGFGIVWIALVLLVIDSVLSASRGRRIGRSAASLAA